MSKLNLLKIAFMDPAGGLMKMTHDVEAASLMVMTWKIKRAIFEDLLLNLGLKLSYGLTLLVT